MLITIVDFQVMSSSLVISEIFQLVILGWCTDTSALLELAPVYMHNLHV